MLADHSTYKPLAKDPTPSLQRQMNALLLSLRRSDHLTESQYNQLRCSAGQIPLLYALPKIHKPEVPLRPIVSFTSSPTYSLSKHLVSILSPLVGNTEHHVQNSLDFAQFINKQTIEKNEVLVSFDVVSLFTKIPTDLAIQAAHKRLLDDTTLDQRTSLTPDEITSLLKLCLNATYFAFRDSFYQQVHGTAMGSPVSVVVADLVMEDVEQRALRTYPNPPKFWKRYVDDTCCILRSDLVDDFHSHLNTIETNIQFTLEIEAQAQLPFLDVLILRNPDKSIDTTVFRKPTHTNKYLDFSSHHPIAHKTAVVRTLIHRANTIPSTAPSKTEEQQTVVKSLELNGYPKKAIERMSQPRQPHLLNPDTTTTNPQFASIPYVQGTSEAIRRILAPLGVKTSFQPTNTLRNMLVHPKDPIPTEKKSGVVYRIPCGSCPQTYIGQTGRTLEQRLKEHKKAVRDENITTSALAEHVQKTGHPIEWTQTEVVHTCNRTVKRCLLESWTIQKEPSPLNREIGTLPTTYKTLL